MNEVTYDRCAHKDFHQRMMEVIMNYIRDNYNVLECYPNSDIAKRIQDDLGVNIGPEMLSRFIFDKASLAISREEDRVKMSPIISCKGKRIWHTRLRKALVWHRAVNDFHFPASILNELEEDA